MNIRMKRIVGAALVFAGWSCGAPAQDDASNESHNAAQDLAGRFYVSPMYSHTFASGRRHTDDADGGMLAIGKQVSPHALIEAYGSYNKYGAEEDGAKDAKLKTAGLAAAAFPWATGDSILGGAYGLIGLNWADGSRFPLRNEKYDQNRSGYAFDIGAGYLSRLPFIRFASLRLDVRYRMNFVRESFASVDPRDEENDDPNINDVVASVGLLIPIGARPAPPPAAPPPVAVVAPEPAAEPAPPPPPPPPPPCKTPAPGERVSLKGCGTGDVIVLRGVNFDFDKASLTVNAKTILDNVAEELTAYPEIKVELSGHTDAKGSDDYNQKLSDRRAESVRKYLIDKGIDGSRMTSVGYGESKPVADNETDEGRELNRRVELRITAGVAASSP